MPDNGYMRVLNDEIPDPDDFDAGREQENDDPTALPGMLSAPEMERIRSLMPIPYIVAIPVKTDDSGKITEVGTLLCADDDGNVVRTVVSWRALWGDSARIDNASYGKRLGSAGVSCAAAVNFAVYGC